jgi:rhamnosyltransferase
MNVTAVIVTYNPGEQLVQNLAKLQPQVTHIIIIDNGSSETSKAGLSTLDPAITILFNETNLGLATALNQGVRAALAKGARWIVTFDQDSIATTDFVKNLLAAYESCSYATQVMLVGPTYQDQTSGEITSMGNDKSLPLYQPIIYTWTSGCLMKASVFEEIGYFRDDFFVDYIDIEYCLRCQKYGFKLIESKGAVLLHNLGQPTQKKFLGKSYTTSNHSPLRRYYNARNRTRVYFEYWDSHASWILGDLSIYIRQLLKLFFLERQRWVKFVYVLRGIKDGLTSKGGKYD